MNRAMQVVLATTLLMAGVRGGWAQDLSEADRNVRLATPLLISADGEARRIFDQVFADEVRASTQGDLCAIAVIPGPAGSFNIRIGVFNVAADRLTFLILDSFRALGGASLLHEAVFGLAPPPGGVIDKLYPAGPVGRGPVVLQFKSFGQLESAAFNTDPDTYGNLNFGATVQDMDDTLGELVYDGNLRCRGRFTFRPGLDASVALIRQVFP